MMGLGVEVVFRVTTYHLLPLVALAMIFIFVISYKGIQYTVVHS